MDRKFIHTDNKLQVFLVFLLIGLLFGAIKINSFNKSQISYKDIDNENLKIMIRQQRQDNISLVTQLENLDKDIFQYQEAISKNKDIYPLLEKEKIKLMEKLQMISTVGKGLKITIWDSDKEELEDDDPNDFVVHDIDILQIINQLKSMGAESIAINNSRVSPNTSINCTGPSISVDGCVYTAPFYITVIGSNKQLDDYISYKGSYLKMLTDVYYIQSAVERNNEVVMPPTSQKNINIKYMKEGK